MASIFLTGISSKQYQYDLCDVNGDWNHIAGNYVFVNSSGSPKYIGETQDFATRRPGPSHERWKDAQHYGAVLVYAHANHGGEFARKAEEADLIRAYNPPCNTQHKPAGGALGLFGLVPADGRKTLLGG